MGEAGLVLETCAGRGSLRPTIIDHLLNRHRETVWAREKETSLVAVAPGKRREELVAGREIMNPSVKDFLEAFKGAGAAFIFPNRPPS